jgi:hypothetical protein
MCYSPTWNRYHIKHLYWVWISGYIQSFCFNQRGLICINHLKERHPSHTYHLGLLTLSANPGTLRIQLGAWAHQLWETCLYMVSDLLVRTCKLIWISWEKLQPNMGIPTVWLQEKYILRLWLWMILIRMNIAKMTYISYSMTGFNSFSLDLLENNFFWNFYIAEHSGLFLLWCAQIPC